MVLLWYIASIYSIDKANKYIASILYNLYIAIMGDKYTDAQKKASIKYLKEKTDSIQIRTAKGTKDRWRAAAEERSKSLNQLIVDAVEKEIAE